MTEGPLTQSQPGLDSLLRPRGAPRSSGCSLAQSQGRSRGERITTQQPRTCVGVGVTEIPARQPKRDGEQSLTGGSLTATQPGELPRATVTVSSTRLW